MERDEIEKQAKEIVAEGKRLYRSEMASWSATDIFDVAFSRKGESGGYFSYDDGDWVKVRRLLKRKHP